MIGKKGQSALEFIMTYGWALVVLLLVISSLWFTFGGDKYFVNEKCMMGPGFLCKDFLVDEGSIQLIVKNSFGKDVLDFTLSSPFCTVGSLPTFIKNGDEVSFAMSECNLNSGDVLDSVLDFEYSFIESSIVHSKSLFITAIVASGNSQRMGGGNGGSGGGTFTPDGATLMLCHFDEDSTCEVGGSPITERNVTFSEWNGRNGVMIDRDVNLLGNPSFDYIRTWVNPPWNVTLNANLIPSNYWSTGFNSGGTGANITETANLYHAHINFPSKSNFCQDSNCIFMEDLNCQFVKSPDENYCHRWLGINQDTGTFSSLGINAGDKLTYSVSAKLDNLNKSANLYLHNPTRNKGIDGSGGKRIDLTKENSYERISYTYTVDGGNQGTDKIYSYIYGSSYHADSLNSEGTIIYDNVQLEYGDTLSPYAGEGPDVLKYPADSTTLNMEKGTVEMWVYVNDKIRDREQNRYIFAHKGSYCGSGCWYNRLSFGFMSSGIWSFAISDSSGNSKWINSQQDTLTEGWHHFAVTWDKSSEGGYAEMFIDGAGVSKLINIANYFPENYEDGIYVGSWSSSSMWANTIIDEFRISDVVRYG